MHRQSDWKRKAGRLSFFLSDANQDTGVRDTPPVLLYSDESVTDLSRDGLRLIQPVKGFRFGEDTVLLSDFAARLFDARPRKSIRVADLGAGSGASSILLMARLPAARVLAVELDPHSFSALERKPGLNRLDDRLAVMQSDYCGGRIFAGRTDGSSLRAAFDLVIVNPPYDCRSIQCIGSFGDTPSGSRVSARQEQTRPWMP
jgi:tRNA1(Val) A37 N6-methylase TrmN6